MSLTTRAVFFRWLSGRTRDGAAAPPVLSTAGPAEMDPSVFSVARPARAVAPEARLALVADILRMSPYAVVPVVEAAPEPSASADGSDPFPARGRLVGLITEADLVARFLAATEPDERARVRQMSAREAMRPPEAWVTPGMRVSEAAPVFDDFGVDVLPVIEGGSEQRFLGLLGRSDLVRDLVRPFRPPVIGGMATPLGVYLTTGGVSGGVGTLALAATGLLTLALQIVSATLFVGFLHLLPQTSLPFTLPPAVRFALGESLALLLQTLFFLCLLRLSPLAGYHAAEHQVVHAIERGEPLRTETVRAMPRVHPRCSTNLVAGALLLWLTGSVLHPVVGVVGYLAGAALAVGYWRSAGAFLQRHFTTRPPTDRQIESGIRAAHAVLEAYGRAPFHVPPPHARLWRMGFFQIFLGAGTGLLALFGLAELFPPLAQWLSLVVGA